MIDNNEGVIEVEGEEISLENKINTSLQRNNVTDNIIAELKAKYGNMRLRSIDDKQSYIEIKESRREVRKIGILAERICEEGRSEALKTQRLWLNKQKEVLAKISEVQDPLDAEIKKFEDEEARKELEAKKEIEEQWMIRQSKLLKLGAEYYDGNFISDHIEYQISLLKEANTEMWESIILPKYRKVYEEKEAVKVAEETKRQLEMEAARRQREEFEKQQAEFKKQQEEFEKQKRELQKMKDDADREKRLDQERKDAEERRKNQEIINGRASQLFALGMLFNPKSKVYYYRQTDVPVDVLLVDDGKWNETFSLVSQTVSALKIQEEQDRQIFEAEKEQAAITKAIADLELKKQQEEQKKIDDLANSLAVAGDKVKYADVVKYLKATPSHEMKSGYYRGKMKVIADFICDLTN